MGTIELSRVDGCRYLIFVDGWCTGWLLDNGGDGTQVYRWDDGVKTVGYMSGKVSLARGVPDSLFVGIESLVRGV